MSTSAPAFGRLDLLLDVAAAAAAAPLPTPTPPLCRTAEGPIEAVRVACTLPTSKASVALRQLFKEPKNKKKNYKRMDRPCPTPVLYSESLAAVRQAKTSRETAFNAPSLTLIREASTIDRLKHAGATPSSTKNKTTFLGLAARPNMPSINHQSSAVTPSP